MDEFLSFWNMRWCLNTGFWRIDNFAITWKQREEFAVRIAGHIEKNLKTKIFSETTSTLTLGTRVDQCRNEQLSIKKV